MPSTLSEVSVGLVGLEDIQDGGRGGITIRPMKPQEIESLKTRFDAGDILYGKLRPYLNKVGIAPHSGLCSTEIWAFGPSPLVDIKFAAFFLASTFFVQRVASLTKGANLPRLDAESFDSVEIPLPPLSEQHRIVELLQEAEEIRRLRAAAEAKTAELIPAMFEGYFGDPVRNPKQWPIETLASVINGTPKNGLYKPAELYGEGTPIIRIGDFTGGILRTSKNLQRLHISDEEIEQFGVNNGQILINRVNSIEHLGKSLLIASLTEPTVYESNMMRLDPSQNRVLPEFLIACLQHESLVAKLRAKAKKAINQASINQTDVLTLNIPVPPLAKQKAFVARVSQTEEIRLLAEYAIRTERAISASLSAHAFSGQLTADWREAHTNQLAREALERDAALKKTGPVLTIPSREDNSSSASFSEWPTESIAAELNSEQRRLLQHIRRRVRRSNTVWYFSGKSLSETLAGSLHRNAHAVNGHLEALAARGLVIPVSREEQTEDTGEYVFGNAYRLPLRDKRPSEGYVGEWVIGDRARLRELERLVAQLEKERALT